MKIFFLLFLPISTILVYLVENLCVYLWLNGKADKCWNYVQIKRRLMSLRVGGGLWYFFDEVPNENVARHHWINLFIGTALSHAHRETERPSDKQGTDKSNSCIVYMYFAKAMKSARTFLIDSSSSYYMLLAMACMMNVDIVLEMERDWNPEHSVAVYICLLSSLSDACMRKTVDMTNCKR